MVHRIFSPRATLPRFMAKILTQVRLLQALNKIVFPDVWHADDPPRHPQVIRILKLTPHLLIINHCSEIGGGVFSLILRRSPSRVERWEWYDYKRQFFNFELPNVYRYSAICAGCKVYSGLLFILVYVTIFVFLWEFYWNKVCWQFVVNLLTLGFVNAL